MKSVAEVCVTSSGIVGDRYATGKGNLTEIVALYGLTDKRIVTLFEYETIVALRRDHGIAIRPEDHRRNITTRGVTLENLVGKKFRIGEVILTGSMSAQPCNHLQQVIGQEVTPLLINRGGLHCGVVRTGTIKVGDVIEAV